MDSSCGLLDSNDRFRSSSHCEPKRLWIAFTGSTSRWHGGVPSDSVLSDGTSDDASNVTAL